MAEVKLRLNLSNDEVELVVDGQVALSSGPEVFKNWVEAYNEKHKPAPTVEEPVEEKQVVVDPEPPVETAETEVVQEVDTAEKE